MDVDGTAWDNDVIGDCCGADVAVVCDVDIVVIIDDVKNDGGDDRILIGGPVGSCGFVFLDGFNFSSFFFR
jgi:hypothetical protein